MPRGDGTGPRGFGPMTGRGNGYCAGKNAPGYANSAGQLGLRRGYGGGGRGWRHHYYATGLPYWARPSAAPLIPEQELAGLKNEAEWLKNQLEVLNRRIEELEPKQQ
jgi:hypothetical protein